MACAWERNLLHACLSCSPPAVFCHACHAAQVSRSPIPMPTMSKWAYMSHAIPNQSSCHKRRKGEYSCCRRRRKNGEGVKTHIWEKNQRKCHKYKTGTTCMYRRVQGTQNGREGVGMVYSRGKGRHAAVACPVCKARWLPACNKGSMETLGVPLACPPVCPVRLSVLIS